MDNRDVHGSSYKTMLGCRLHMLQIYSLLKLQSCWSWIILAIVQWSNSTHSTHMLWQHVEHYTMQESTRCKTCLACQSYISNCSSSIESTEWRMSSWCKHKWVKVCKLAVLCPVHILMKRSRAIRARLELNDPTSPPDLCPPRLDRLTKMAFSQAQSAMR